MKKLLSFLLVAVLCLATAFSFTGCDGNKGTGDGNSTPTPTPLPEDIDPSTVDVIGTMWQVTELSFNSTKKYVATKGEQGKVVFDCVFTHRDTGETITRPGFWDGGDVFKIRFAPTLHGVWDYETKCESDADLNGHTGSIGANAYKGDLEIYRRGFIKVDPEKKYFMFNDGTPFFYLGDTHWGMLNEEFDEAGKFAGNLQTDSHFKYIVDKRVEQGFTVYQSEPIGAKFDLLDGKIDRLDVEGFQHADQYFQYIAEKGLVHANAQFFFPTYGYQLGHNYKALEEFSRYWVARFGAYPVMWTLAQEIDNDFYAGRGDQTYFTHENNPWVKVAEYMNKYDSYDHPLSGHQEGAGRTSVTGAPSHVLDRTNDGKSAFLDEDVTARTGHNWWASQWGVDFENPETHFEIAKDYWQSYKVGVMYEGKYCYLWTKDFGSRAQGWIAYLNGCFGYGYGAQDMWNYMSDYSTEKQTSDGYEVVTVKDKQMKWSTSIELPSGYQVGYMKEFFQQIEWWKLVPDFDSNTYFTPEKGGAHYSAATIGNDVYVVYLFSKDSYTGYLNNMDGDATYTMKWFNPRTNEYILIGEEVAPNIVGSDGNPAYMLDGRPDRSAEDWVVLAIKNK